MNRIFAVVVVFLLMGCDSDSYSNPEDIMLNAYDALIKYSHFQDALPNSAFEYNTPSEMLYHVNDTLKGSRYTYFVQGYALDSYIKSSDQRFTYSFGCRFGSFSDTLFCSQVYKPIAAFAVGSFFI